jgi:hypothetical protein
MSEKAVEVGFAPALPRGSPRGSRRTLPEAA